MHDLPQSNIVNPAIPIKCKFYMGFPLLGSTHINTVSSGFAINDLIVPHTSDSLRFEIDDSIDGMNSLEVVSSEVHLAILTMGYKHKDNYFTFAINEKINTYNIIPKTLVQFLNDGNSQFEGRSVYMDGLRVNTNHYREYAFGWAREVNEDFNFGVRVKLLFGKANAYTKPSNIRSYTQGTSFNTNLHALVDMYTSFPVNYTVDENGKLDEVELQEDIDWYKYAMNKENKGYGIDLGFTYKLNEITTLSGSILDIGYIKWNSDANHLQSNGVIDITGTTFEEELQSTSEIGDSIAEMFTPTVVGEVYSSPLTPALYLGITRDMNNRMNVGAVFHTEMYKQRWHPSLTFSGNGSLTKNIYGSVSYTLQNNQFNNIGLGVGIKMGWFHFHAISDNVPAFLNLTAARNVNLRFGLSILTGCGKKSGKSKAIPCVGDPYHAVHRPSTKRRKKR